MDLSIQEMVKETIHEIPEKYLVDQEPAVPIDHSTLSMVPVLDMNCFLDEETKVFALEKLHLTCQDWGIFQLVNHGVDCPLLEKLKSGIQEFYKLPLEERLKYKIRDGEFEGYGQTKVHSANHKAIDWADRFYMITNPISRRKPHLFPQLPSSLRKALEAYIVELQKLSRTMFGLIAEALKIDKGEVEEMFEDGMQSMRMTYYPQCPEPNKVIGLTPHSDGSGITFLLQVNGVEGLQIKRHGVWMPINILPNALVVNLGDAFEILSNGVYKSIEHRVIVFSEKERISLAMFFNPKFDVELGPSPSLLINGEPPLFRRIKMEQYVKDFFARRLDGKSFLSHMKI